MIETIFTENPEDDLWRELLQYSYKANVTKYLNEHSFSPNETLINSITGSILQAHEYYSACKHANLQISPLLLYYGTTNLLFGATALTSGSIPVIKSHGMNPDLPTGKNYYIAETNIVFSDSERGGIHNFLKSFDCNEDLTKYGTWQLKDFISSIAEINNDYQRCYSEKIGNVLMLDVIKSQSGYVERIYYTNDNYSSILEAIRRVENFNSSYLKPSSGHDHATDQDFIILRPKLNSVNIKKKSFFGQPYLQAGIIKNGHTISIPPLFNMYISLFIMGSLCRYHPEIWGPFALTDETGERLLVEKLMYYARRMLPNIILNKLYSKDMTYVTQRYIEKETIKFVNEHEVKELISQELYLRNQHNFIDKL
ncbi:MAG: YaaC family protein [Acetatifactor sp.]|nr:YaaC family protein [Acetatifactor sp.]